MNAFNEFALTVREYWWAYLGIVGLFALFATVLARATSIEQGLWAVMLFGVAARYLQLVVNTNWAKERKKAR